MPWLMTREQLVVHLLGFLFSPIPRVVECDVFFGICNNDVQICLASYNDVVSNSSCTMNALTKLKPFGYETSS